MSNEELKPVAWVVIECYCRAPDDCEDCETLISAEEFAKNASHYSRYVEHGRAFPLYIEPHSAPITREQVNEWCKAAGMVVVPLEATYAMLVAAQDKTGNLGAWPEHSMAYTAMIKAAQESS
jgi:hypothetical protein